MNSDLSWQGGVTVGDFNHVRSTIASNYIRKTFGPGRNHDRGFNRRYRAQRYTSLMPGAIMNDDTNENKGRNSNDYY